MCGTFSVCPVKSTMYLFYSFLDFTLVLAGKCDVPIERAVKHENGGVRAPQTGALLHSHIGASAVLIWWCPQRYSQNA